MLCTPTVKAESVKEAEPLASTTDVETAVPSTVNVMLPVGITPVLFTVALNLTEERASAGDALDVSATVVLPAVTTKGSGADVLALSLPSPP
jgi:hypothetical protein